MHLLCGHCGHPRTGGAPAYRCTCIPARVWEDPDIARAAQAMNLPAVIQGLRRHPATRRLRQTALAEMCGLSQAMISRLESGLNVTTIDRASAALTGLGAPEQPRPDDAPLPPVEQGVGPGTACVVITSPVPIDVQVVDPPDTSASHHGDVAFIAAPSGPRLVVNRDIPWGVTSAPAGATAWFALPSSAPNTPNTATAHELKAPP